MASANPNPITPPNVVSSRSSFTSCDLAKEGLPIANTNTPTSRRRKLIKLALVFLGVVSAVALGSVLAFFEGKKYGYRVGGWEAYGEGFVDGQLDALNISRLWVDDTDSYQYADRPTPFYPRGILTDETTGMHYRFRHGEVAYGWKGDLALDSGWKRDNEGIKGEVKDGKWVNWSEQEIEERKQGLHGGLWGYAKREHEREIAATKKSSDGQTPPPWLRVTPDEAAATATMTKRKRSVPAPAATAVVRARSALDDSDSDSEGSDGSGSDKEVVVLATEETDSDSDEAENSDSDEAENSDSDEVENSDSDEAENSDSDEAENSDSDEETVKKAVVVVKDETATPEVVVVKDENLTPDVVEVHDPSAAPDTIVVKEEDPDIVEIQDENLTPDVVEVHDHSAAPDTIVVEDDADPTIVVEESEEEVTDSDEDSDSEDENKPLLPNQFIRRDAASPPHPPLANPPPVVPRHPLRPRGQPGNYPQPSPPEYAPPYANGDDPWAFHGQGDRAVTDGIRRFRSIPPEYNVNFVPPKSPEMHRIQLTEEHGGFRIADGYYPFEENQGPTYPDFHRPQKPAPKPKAAPSSSVASSSVAGYVVTLTIPGAPAPTGV